jgi:hypothetical protein
VLYEQNVNGERTDYIIQNWLRNRNTVEFLGIWEQLNNPDFNPIEFDGIRKQAGLNSFILTAKRWIESTGAIGLTSVASTREQLNALQTGYSRERFSMALSLVSGNFDGSLAPNLGHRAIATPDPEAAIRALCLDCRINLQGRRRFPKAPFVVPIPHR